ncbi:MAG: hypothetical protein HY791_03225 [Deltaproteobacteria bacterium]|nr:hypothetical protein [Deltaproteobacteria bacterium]
MISFGPFMNTLEAAELPPQAKPSTEHLDPLCLLGWVDRGRTEARACLSCHDGSVSTGREHEVRGVGLESHPVDVPYESRQVGRTNSLRPTVQLEPAIVLVDGRLVCTSCHDGSSSLPAKLAISMNGSGLCLACHAL